jgi:glutamyl-tRNA reductase
MSIVVIGLSYRTSPVTVRERFALPDKTIPDALAQIRSSGIASEAVILSTCNRVELYAATSLEEKEAICALRRFLVEHHKYSEPLKDEIYAHSDPQSLEHLFKVACGMDSMVLGETEILGQLKKAYDLALQTKHTGCFLNKAFQKAFNVAKQIRTETNIQRGTISVASVGVELAEKVFSALSNHNVLVIGAGDTSEKTARALMSRGAKSILVTNRSHDRAVALAQEFKGRAIPFENWPDEFVNIDIIISSTAAPNHVITLDQLQPLMKTRKNRPLLLIDLAVPRDIDPRINSLDNVYLYNVDDMQAIATDCQKQRHEEIALCEAIIRERARTLTAHHGLHFKPFQTPTA